VGAHRPRSPRGARRRSYSQNFLASRALAAQLVREARVGRGDLIVEVGVGSGVLTAELARRAGSVRAVEIDPIWATRLRERFAASRNVEVIEAATIETGGRKPRAGGLPKVSGWQRDRDDDQVTDYESGATPARRLPVLACSEVSVPNQSASESAGESASGSSIPPEI